MRFLLAATFASGTVLTGTLASGPALADSCCILKTANGNICVNATGPFCRAHPRFVSFNPKQVCRSPGSTKDIRCVNKPKGWSATERDKEIFLKYFDGIKPEDTKE